MRFPAFAVAAFVLATGALVAQQAQTPEVLLKSAIDQELMDGDLEAAILQYKALAERYQTNHAVAARALLQLAGCYEKLGRSEARETYARIVTAYGDQTAAVATARAQLDRIDGGRATSQHTGAAGNATFRLVLDKGLPRLHEFPYIFNRSDVDFSPDGERFVIRTTAMVGGVRRSRLDLSDAASSVVRPLADQFDTWWGFEFPRWSPDGKSIAYVAYGGVRPDAPVDSTTAVFVVSVDGRSRRQVGPLLGTPGGVAAGGKQIIDLSWTPDGKHVTVLRPRGIFSLSVATGEETLVQAMPIHYSTSLGGYSSDGKWLAFDRQSDGTNDRTDIWIMPATGGRAVQLTHGTGIEAHPTWAPDGPTLYFVSSRAGEPNIWRMKIDTTSGAVVGASEQVTFYSDASLLFPKVLARGRQIGFVMLKRTSTISAAAADRIDVARIVSRGMSAQPSPDGRVIYYLGEGPGREGIYAVPRDGGPPRRLTAQRPAGRLAGFVQSPDGASLAYFTLEDGNQTLFVLPTAGGSPRPLVTVGTSGGALRAAWSPDGSQIAYVDGDTLYVISPRGGDRRKLAQLYAWQAFTIRWSPDGAYVAGLGYGKPNDGIGVWIVPASGGDPVRITQGDGEGYLEGLAWHPDGKRLTYVNYLPDSTATGSDSEIRMAYVDGRRTNRLINQPDHWDYVGTWAPDGRHFFFVSAPNESDGTWRTYRYDAETATMTPVASSNDIALPAWSGDGKTMVWVTQAETRQIWVMEQVR